ncbi:MAG: tetratricopeptide repeat protein [Tepidisphaeraceae bacterium]
MARRVNTRFLTVLTIIVVVLGVGALLMHFFSSSESPEKFVAAGQQLMLEKKYEEAAKAFGRAVQLDQKKPELWVAYGDALNEMSPLDVEWMRRAQEAWQQALVADPKYMPALDRMMQWYTDFANLDATNPQIFKGLHETARRLYEADPKNAAAEVAIYTSIIRPWLVGVEDDPKRIEQTIDRLIGLMKKYPDNADLPMFVAQARLRESDRLRQQDRAEPAQKKAAEAGQIVEEALKRSGTASMYFSAAQVMYGQEVLDRGNAQKWRDKRREYFTKARELAKPEDPLYIYIHIAAARASADKQGEAETILRELYKARPDDQEVRLALAEHLAGDRSKRDGALEILDLPFANEAFRGPKAFKVRELQIRTMVMATNLRLDVLVTSNDEAKRKAALDKIQKNLDVIALRDGEGPRLLRLRGKLLRLQGKTIEAIQTLEKAKQLAERSQSDFQAERMDRWEVIDMLARAYIDTKQIGRAKDLLTELVNKFPQYDPARMLLTQVLVKEGQLEDAARHVKILAERKPDDPDVIKLQLQVSDPRGIRDLADKDKERAQLKQTYARLPEGTKAEAMDKVVAAMVIDQSDEAIRLINKLQSQTPADADVARLAIKVHTARNDPEAARAAVDVAIKAKPDDPQLQVLVKQVADLTPENLAKIAIEEFKKNPDPFIGELGQANAYRRLNKPEEQLQHLLAAVKLKPNDGDASAYLFAYYLDQQQWAKAEALLPTLAAVNQDQTGGLLFRYRLAMARQDYTTALNYARALVQRMGEFGQSWLALAQALQATSQIEDALKNYTVALEKQSDSPEALRGAIECLYALNRPADAKRKIDDARRIMPGNPYFQELQISHDLAWGNPESAIAPREEQLKKSPERAPAMMALGQAYLATARARAGKAADSTKTPDEMFAKARKTFKDGIAKWPDEMAFYAYYAETGARSAQLGDTEVVLKQLAARDAWKDKPEPQLLLAEFYGIARRPADAEAAFRTVLAKHPSAETQIKLANLLINQKKLDEALKVLDGNPNDIRVARRKVDVLLASNRPDDAEATLDQALKSNPSSLELLQLAAGVHTARGKFDLAEQCLSRALEVDQNNATTHYYVGLMRMNQPKPDLDDAVKHLQLAKASPKMGIEARFALADCLRRRDNQDAAIRELEEALKGQPNNRRVRTALIDAYASLVPARNNDALRLIREVKALPNYQPDAEILRREANLLAAGGENKDAVDRITEALAASPDDMQLTRQALDLYLKARKLAEVNLRVEQLVAKDKNLWWAYQARALSKRLQGNKDEAVKEFELALNAANTIKDDPASEEVIRTMGDAIGVDEAINRISGRAEKEDRWKLVMARLYQTKGDNASAIKALEQVLARAEQLLPEQRENAYRFGGTLYLIANQPEKSQQCYTKLLDMVPNDMTALNNIACLLTDVVQPPRPQEGLKYSQNAYDLMIKAGRRDPLVYDTHGWVLTKCGKVDEGIDVLRRSIEIRPTPDANYHLGEAYLLKGFAAEAQRELEKADMLVKRAKSDKLPIDPSLGPKIEGAIARAGVMLRQKKGPAAPTPTAANVP